MKEIQLGTYTLSIDDTIDTLLDEGGCKLLLCHREMLNTLALIQYFPETDEIELHNRWSLNCRISGHRIQCQVVE